jgi:hypothetical protein
MKPTDRIELYPREFVFCPALDKGIMKA